VAAQVVGLAKTRAAPEAPAQRIPLGYEVIERGPGNGRGAHGLLEQAAGLGFIIHFCAKGEIPFPMNCYMPAYSPGEREAVRRGRADLLRLVATPAFALPGMRASFVRIWLEADTVLDEFLVEGVKGPLSDAWSAEGFRTEPCSRGSLTFFVPHARYLHSAEAYAARSRWRGQCLLCVQLLASLVLLLVAAIASPVQIVDETTKSAVLGVFTSHTRDP